jgi:hydroxymethylglutaryl-CoA synthase
MKIGIDSIYMYIPKLELPIEKLATERNIEPKKLKKGLGLTSMRMADIDEDTVSMATTAVYQLLENEGLNLKELDRLYVGTESGIDNSKPIASYILQNIMQESGENISISCDAVDFTFACIGAVDALQNCMDYIRLNPEKKAIVVATDFAKYELGSSGEYTQGAGAFAMLIKSNPRLLAFNPRMGISTKGVFDFFKPKIPQNLEVDGKLTVLPIIKDEPVFDGQYSNQCYIEQIKNAFTDFKKNNADFTGSDEWDLICMHLPYCYQGRRTFVHIYAEENKEILVKFNGESLEDKIKVLSKSDEYLELVSKKIAPSEKLSSQVGNCYTGSIFLGLVSALNHLAENNETASKVGFIAYGSGSKSKVFEAELVVGWEKHFNRKQVLEQFNNTQELSFAAYEKLHKKLTNQPLSDKKQVFTLTHIEEVNQTMIGARFYEFKK